MFQFGALIAMFRLVPSILMELICVEVPRARRDARFRDPCVCVFGIPVQNVLRMKTLEVGQVAFASAVTIVGAWLHGDHRHTSRSRNRYALVDRPALLSGV